MEHNITVILPDRSVRICYTPSENLSLKDILADNNILLNSDCGGHGICGKCKVYIKNFIHDDISDPSAKDICSCRFFPKEDMIIQIPRESLLYSNIITESGSSISSNIQSTVDRDSESSDDSDKPCLTESGELYAAVDLGSTTISVSLLHNTSVINTDTFFNPTLAYGSDIITRQQAQAKGRCDEFSKLLKDSIRTSLVRLASRCGSDISCIKSLCISGNTTMQYFLYGLDTTSLSAYPFDAETLNFDLYGLDGINTVNVPSLSAYIGGDIMSGLYYINRRFMQQKRSVNKPFLFLDLGTNAEMVLGINGRYICTSAAAGPAFEGTNISCGCAAIPGAINKVRIHKSRKHDYSFITYETIGNKYPIGVCGSGILSIYSQLIENNYVDETGTLTETYFESGFPIYIAPPERNLYVSQKDIRELQLAIAAIRTGIIYLLKKGGITVNDLDSIFISGSFGKALDIETLKSIGLLPGADRKLYNKIVLTGNTSLEGARLLLSDCSSDTEDGFASTASDVFENIKTSCNEIILATEPDFNNIFLANI